MNFDEIIDRRGTHSMKWDMMERLFGVPSADGIAMWVADMDFRPPKSAEKALSRLVDHGIYGYFGDDRDAKKAVAWWMRTRHSWEVLPEWIFTAHGLVNGTALCIDAFSWPGDGIALFTPVYHAFARIISASERSITELPLVERGDRYEMDFGSYSAKLNGNEKILLLCSPHNPGGTVWTVDELKELANFCREQNLLLISDEIHHDLLMPGSKHTPMPLAAPEIQDRLIMMTAITKTFNLAGAHLGNVIIPDSRLREQFGKRAAALGISPNSFGMFLIEAVYSECGAEWLDELMPYLDGNRKLFDDAVNGLPGVRSMPLEATYLAWVDFRGTGLPNEEVQRRIEQVARIAVNHGPSFGTGGLGCFRFNIATPRSVVEQAADRMLSAFADLG